jgi:hypothetical protein
MGWGTAGEAFGSGHPGAGRAAGCRVSTDTSAARDNASRFRGDLSGPARSI